MGRRFCLHVKKIAERKKHATLPLSIPLDTVSVLHVAIPPKKLHFHVSLPRSVYFSSLPFAVHAHFLFP